MPRASLALLGLLGVLFVLALLAAPAPAAPKAFGGMGVQSPGILTVPNFLLLGLTKGSYFLR